MGGPQSHYPVRLKESIEWLRIRPDGLYADCTAGLGGHTRAIAGSLNALGGTGRVLAVDWDEESLDLCRRNTQELAPELAGRIEYWRGRFSNLVEGLHSLGEAKDRPSSPGGQTQHVRLDGLLAESQVALG